MSIISLDTETTGLDPERHEVWEVGLVSLKTNDEWLFQFPVQKLREADPGALRINRYFKRCEVAAGSDAVIAEGPGCPVQASPGVGAWVTDGSPAPVLGAPEAMTPRDAAFHIAHITTNVTLLGCNVAWDAQMLANLLRFYDQAPAWKHRFLELGSFAAGQLNRNEPLSTQTLAGLYGPPDEAHTALGDARWNVDVYRNLIAQREGRDTDG